MDDKKEDYVKATSDIFIKYLLRVTLPKIHRNLLLVTEIKVRENMIKNVDINLPLCYV